MVAENLNNDTIPVGTTVHINPEDIKWESTKGDLISRSVLKEVINYNQMYVNPKLAVDDVIKIIDNAPTVDALPREYHDRVLDMTVAELQACQANLRPQGEWQVTDIPASTLCKCSICNFDLGAYSFNFCPNCGADMRKGDAE